MEIIQIKAEFLFELSSKQDWINNVPRCMPAKKRMSEQWVWVDKNGNTMLCGSDFADAEKAGTYPCKVYRLITVEEACKNGK